MKSQGLGGFFLTVYDMNTATENHKSSDYQYLAAIWLLDF